MIGKALWQNLKILVDCDRQILEFKQKIEDETNTQKNNQQLMTRLQTSLEEKKHQYIAKKKNVALQELTAQEFKNLIDEKKQHLENISHHKEYKALEKEINLLAKQREEQEDLLINAWNDLSGITKLLEEETHKTQERIAHLHQEHKQKEELIVHLQHKVEELLKQRTTILSPIPDDWLKRYERMKHAIPDPIVPVTQGICSSCYYSILHQDLHKLKKAGVLPCRNCYRFLYYEEEEKKHHEATGS